MVETTVYFKVDVVLSAPEVVLRPSKDELFRRIMQCFTHCVDSTQVGSSLFSRPGVGNLRLEGHTLLF